MLLAAGTDDSARPDGGQPPDPEGLEQSLLPGVSQPAPEAPEEETGAADDGPVTRAELSAILRTFGADVTKRFQSMADKKDNVLFARMQQIVAGDQRALQAAKELGLPAETQAALQQRLEQSALRAALATGFEGQTDGARPAVGAPDGRGEPGLPRAADDFTGLTNEEITEKGLGLMERYGLDDGDPEMAGLIRDGTPEEYLASIHAAGQIKRRRLAQRNAQPARNPAYGSGGPPAPKVRTRNIQDPSTLYDMADEDLRKGLGI